MNPPILISAVAAETERFPDNLLQPPLRDFVLLAIWSQMHLERMEWWHPVLIVAGSLFSALTVVDWGTIVFRSFAKATGFAVLVEGVMLGSEILWLSIFALCLLVVINGVNSAVNLVRNNQRKC